MTITSQFFFVIQIQYNQCSLIVEQMILSIFTELKTYNITSVVWFLNKWL